MRFGKFEMIRRIRRPEHHAVELGPGAPKCFCVTLDLGLVDSAHSARM
jgi:hypothetical protein